MSQNWKPVIEEIKAKFGNPEHIRLTVEKTLKTVAEEAKESRLANEIVYPALESQRADEALTFLTDRLSSTPLAKYDIAGKINLARKAILSFKVQPNTTSEAGSSAPTEPMSSTPADLAAEAKTAATAFETETDTAKPAKRKARTAPPTEEN